MTVANDVANQSECLVIQGTISDPSDLNYLRNVVGLVAWCFDGTEWFHTRGMRKFGRPDLSVHHVSRDLRDGIVDLFNRFIEFQAFGGIIAQGQDIKMGSLPAGMICVHQGDLDDPDFNNVHVEIKR